MKALLATLALAALWLDTSAASASRLRGRGVSDFIQKQSGISLNGVLANMGPDGSKAGGAAPGVVIASPSKQDPDCESTRYPRHLDSAVS